jgi:hypothetical protein
MPFPLAHPAAVLPLRRVRQLNFGALLIGAITPDLSYCFERYHLDAYGHTIAGCFGFSLPVGWLFVLIFHVLRDPLVRLLPAPHRQALLMSFRKPGPRWFAVPLSVVIGAATHVFWDAFTHEVGWFVERSSFLQMKLFTVEGRSFRMYRLLWHVSTWAGLLLLCRAYLQTLKECTGSARLFAAAERSRYALWAAILALPLAGVLPLVAWRILVKGLSLAETMRSLRMGAAVYLVAVAVVLVAIGTGLKLRKRSPE